MVDMVEVGRGIRRVGRSGVGGTTEYRDVEVELRNS